MSLWDNILNSSGADLTTLQQKDPCVKTNNKSINKKDNRINCNNANIVLTRKGISIDVYLLQDLNIHRKIINKFTISIPTLMGYDIKVTNHIHELDTMKYIFPRFGFLEYIETNLKNYNFSNKIGLGKFPSAPFKWSGTFTNNQPIVADYIMKNYFNDENSKLGKAGVILNLAAGQGKTFLATGLIEKIQRKTLVITHNKTILHQWIKILKTAYVKNKIAHFYGEKKEDGDIVVGVINSLLKQPKKYFHQFGYVILDEVHEYVAKSRKKIYSLASSTYMLGLSATPHERADNLDTVNLWNCGPILVAKDLDGYTEDDIPFQGEVKMIKYNAPAEYTIVITNKTLDVISFSEMVSQMCSDPFRIHLIVKTILILKI